MDLSISRLPQPQTSIDAADLNTPWDEIEEVLNGPTSTNPGTGLGESNFGPNFPVVTAQTVAGLGTGRAGKEGKLRLAASPFEIVGLVYDGTIGKWVSEAFLACRQNDEVTTTNSAYSAIGTPEMPRFFIPHYKAYYAAGLRPQVWVGGRLSNSGANTTRARVSIREVKGGDSALSGAVFTGGEIVQTVAAAAYRFAAWATMTLDTTNFPTGPTEDHGVVVPEMNRSAGTGTLENFCAWMRWVSA